jgi:hypothetical protein
MELELIERLRIVTELEMKAVLDIGEISAEHYQTVTQNYLLFKIFEQLEDISKSLNLIAVYTSKSNG